MKVLQVCPIFPPQPGNFASGVTQVLYYMNKELVKRGHKIEVWAAKTLDLKTRSKNKTAVVDGIGVHYFSYLMHYYTFFLSPSLVQAARSRLNEFDVIHIHDFRTFHGPVVAHYAQKNGIPYVLQAYGSLPRMMAVPKLKQAYDTLWGYQLLSDASKVIALNKTEAEQYKSMGVGKDKIEIIPNGIDLSEFQNLPRRGQFREKYGLDANQKIILYLGRIHKIKGLDLLVEAFVELIKKFHDVKLAIVGPDDGYLPIIKKRIDELGISSKVLLTGHLHERERLTAYVDADVYVLPSVYDISPSTVLEACACATPVIITSSCGLANWVEDYHAGYVVPHDKDQLQQALSVILIDEKLRQQLGNQARRLVEEQFDWNKIANQVEATYEAVIHNP
jgi:glycosyltransferase involved in cell wall biosynthesis